MKALEREASPAANSATTAAIAMSTRRKTPSCCCCGLPRKMVASAVENQKTKVQPVPVFRMTHGNNWRFKPSHQNALHFNMGRQDAVDGAYYARRQLEPPR
jgi:hypothetical protein